MICSKTSAPIDKFAYFPLKPVRSFSIVPVMHELSYIILNPVESIPAKICVVPLITMKNEIIFSSNELLILSVNFCNVVK